MSCATLGGQPGHVPVPAQQEERGDVGRAPGAVLDHLDVEAVVVVGVVSDDHGAPTMLLDHSCLGQEGAAPVAQRSHCDQPLVATGRSKACTCQSLPGDTQTRDCLPDSTPPPNPAPLSLYFKHKPPTLLKKKERKSRNGLGWKRP